MWCADRPVVTAYVSRLFLTRNNTFAGPGAEGGDRSGASCLCARGEGCAGLLRSASGCPVIWARAPDRRACGCRARYKLVLMAARRLCAAAGGGDRQGGAAAAVAARSAGSLRLLARRARNTLGTVTQSTRGKVSSDMESPDHLVGPDIITRN